MGTRVLILGMVLGVLLAVQAGAEMDEWVRSLEAAERSFAATVADKDVEAFAAHLDEQAIFAAGRILAGRDAIVEGWSGFFAKDGPQMEWHPDKVVVRADGTFGLSQGPYTLTITQPDGSQSVQKGRFISTWQRQEDGSWRILFDSGCPPCPECGSPSPTP